MSHRQVHDRDEEHSALVIRTVCVRGMISATGIRNFGRSETGNMTPQRYFMGSSSFAGS